MAMKNLKEQSFLMDEIKNANFCDLGSAKFKDTTL